MAGRYVAASVAIVCAPSQAKHDGHCATAGYSVGMLSALSCAGYTYRIGPDTYLPTDVSERSEHRASIVARHLPPGSISVLRTAAWLHAGGPFPAELDVVMPGRRARAGPQVRPRYVVIGEDECERIGALLVTTAVRTAIDVATLLPRAQALPVLARLSATTTCSAADALAALDRTRRSQHARARATLAAVADGEPQ